MTRSWRRTPMRMAAIVDPPNPVAPYVATHAWLARCRTTPVGAATLGLSLAGVGYLLSPEHNPA